MVVNKTTNMSSDTPQAARCGKAGQALFSQLPLLRCFCGGRWKQRGVGVDELLKEQDTRNDAISFCDKKKLE